MTEKAIVGFGSVKTEPLGALEAITLYADLMRVISHASDKIPAILFGLTSGEEGTELLADMAAINAVADILKNTSSPDIVGLLVRITESAMILQPSGSYRTIIFDGDFTGKLQFIGPVIKLILTEQFSDFFTVSAGDGIFGTLRAVLQRKKSPE